MLLASSTAILHPSVLGHEQLAITQIPRLMKAAGFDALDWSLWNFSLKNGVEFTGFLNQSGWQLQVEALALADQNAGIPCIQTHCVSTNAAKYHQVNHEQLRKQELRCLSASAMLGCKWMVIHPFSQKADENATSEENFLFFREYLQPIIELAHKVNVGIAVENMIQGFMRPPRFCATANELAAFVDFVNDPLVGACWDTGHGNLFSQKAGQAIRCLGNRLKATHINDNLADNRDLHLLPGEGTVDWQDVTSALHDIHYAHAFAFEHALTPMQIEAVPQSLAAMAKLGRGLIG